MHFKFLHSFQLILFFNFKLSSIHTLEIEKKVGNKVKIGENRKLLIKYIVHLPIE
jgi:hypothetical protein